MTTTQARRSRVTRVTALELVSLPAMNDDGWKQGFAAVAVAVAIADAFAELNTLMVKEGK
jgi:hypothetical protein